MLSWCAYVRAWRGSVLTHTQFLGTSLIASSVTAVLCFGLPDYLPGKRAFAVQLLIFHAIVSALWLQANPTVVQVEFPVALRAYLPPPERIPFTKLVGVLHGLLSLVISGWYVASGTRIGLTQQVASYGAGGAAGCAPGELARQVALSPQFMHDAPGMSRS